ncbi:GH16337 [Drosophila grimshawi]|uniref:GH16337 n=2 Tax=Drosophila grimshawi TaxID=7222 RepID=B4IYQ4_DROGR|nr:GH16337 [Drosophila grimshawi]
MNLYYGGLVPPPLSDECSEAGSFIPDKSSCNGYYLCYEGDDGQMLLHHGDCPVGGFFYVNDNGIGVCKPRSQVQCDYDRCVNLGYTNIELANESNDGCKGYVLCQDGVSIFKGTCPNGEYFNELTQRCTTQVISYTACVMTRT